MYFRFCLPWLLFLSLCLSVPPCSPLALITISPGNWTYQCTAVFVLASGLALATRYKNANTVDDDMPVDDDADKNVPKSRKRRRKANKFRRVRQAVMNAKKNELTKPKRPDAASAPTSKPKRIAGADEVKPASYAPGKFRDARLDFIRRQMHEQSLSWKEACKLWLPSAERASFLQGMSKSELSKRRFNV